MLSQKIFTILNSLGIKVQFWIKLMLKKHQHLFIKVFNLLSCLDKGSTPEFQLPECLGVRPGHKRANNVTSSQPPSSAN